MKKKQPPARRPHKPYSPHRGITVFPPVAISNAACPRCNGDLMYSPRTWVFCPKCSTVRAARQLATVAGKAVAS